MIAKKVSALTCIALSACAGVSQNHSGYTPLPIIKLGENQNDCEGSKSVEIVYPERFRGSNYSFTLFQSVENGKLKFEAYLARVDSLPGSFLCIDDQLQKISRVFVLYGDTQCSSYKYKFGFANFRQLLQGEDKLCVKTKIREDPCEG